MSSSSHRPRHNAHASLSIEHLNITAFDPERTARLLQALFGWYIRWQGPALNNGQTIHVGAGDHYLALYTQPEATYSASGFPRGTPLNHIGIVVDDLDEAEGRVRAEGLTPFNQADYEPGRRFYFLDHEQIEYELVSYDERPLPASWG